MKIKKVFLYLMLTACISGCEVEGPEGKKSLLDVSVESAGDNCATGGIKIASGIDLNGDDILNDDEIQDLEFVCNGVNGLDGEDGIDGLNGSDGANGQDGANGVDGLNSVMDVEEEPAGGNCSSGGFKVSTGIDLNGNAVLDEEEVQSINYICHGDDGGYDKQIEIDFGGNFVTESTSPELIHHSFYIQKFDISNYAKADSIVFGALMWSYGGRALCSIELYDVTNNQPIPNTLISTSERNSTWVETSVNFMDDLPKSPITLAVRGYTSIQGIGAWYTPKIYIYRN